MSMFTRPESARLAAILKGASHPHCLAILSLLESRPHTVGELARLLAVGQPAASYYVKKLRQAGMVWDDLEYAPRLTEMGSAFLGFVAGLAREEAAR